MLQSAKKCTNRSHLICNAKEIQWDNAIIACCFWCFAAAGLRRHRKTLFLGQISHFSVPLIRSFGRGRPLSR